MSHKFTLYELHKIVHAVVKTNILQYTRLYTETLEAKILFMQRLVVDSLIEELKVGPHS